MTAAARRITPAVFALLLAASPAAAQWTRVLEAPATDMYAVFADGDTIAAGGDSLVHLSTDAGVTWKTTAKVAPGVISVQGVAVRDGRIYAGTYGQGVFVSDDLGDTWTAYNQGLSGGIFGTHNFLSDLMVHGDSLYASTAGAGVYVRNLKTGGWTHFGEQFEPNQSSNTNDIAAGPSRLLVSAGFNGTVFFRDPGDPDWTLSWLDNTGIAPGLAALSAVWTGANWVVGSNIGVFTSPVGEEPWTLVDLGHGTIFSAAFAANGGHLYAAFGTGITTFIERSLDGGASWQLLEQQDFTFVYHLAVAGDVLYAGRGDGLWRRPASSVSVPGGGAPPLRFALAGAQPVRDDVRFRLELPEAGSAVIEVFDVAGRRAAEPIEGLWPAGRHEVAFDAGRLAPGVYSARLTASGRTASARFVRVR